MAAVETFSPHERAALAPYFTELDGPVFALVNLPEVVKGALFARYSRSAKSLRRLFLDEFLERAAEAAPRPAPSGRARRRSSTSACFGEYGDDSVAQLGGVHLACEGASNILTKVLEWGRLMAYLEQSTRYVPTPIGRAGAGSTSCPRSSTATPARALPRALDRAFETYARGSPHREYYAARSARAAASRCGPTADDPRQGARRLRGLLPAATGPTWASSAPARPTRRSCCACARIRSRGPRLRAISCSRAAQGHPRLPAARRPARARRRLDALSRGYARGDRGGRGPRARGHRARAAARGHPHRLGSGRRSQGGRRRPLRGLPPAGRPAARRVARKLAPRSAGRCWRPTSAGGTTAATSRAAPSSAPPTASTCSATTAPSATCSATGCSRSSGSRSRRGTAHVTPEELGDAGVLDGLARVMEDSAALHDALAARDSRGGAVRGGHGLSRALLHGAERARGDALIELRTAPQGHPAYRRVCQAMHRLIAEQAGTAHRGGHGLRGPLGRGGRAARRGARRRAPARAELTGGGVSARRPTGR